MSQTTACLPSQISPMTDFHQRQAVSTLTAPAARGLTPHYLVQPGTRHALYPATGTFIDLCNYYTAKNPKMQLLFSFSLQSFRPSAIMAEFCGKQV